MRKTVIPLLRHLPNGVVIQRCGRCGELAFVGEMCKTDKESEECPSRGELEEAAARVMAVA
jgi:hypothetical protein